MVTVKNASTHTPQFNSIKELLANMQNFVSSYSSTHLTMTPSIAEFEAKGWFLSQEGIDLIAAENDGVSTLDDYIACAKDVS